MVKFVREGMLWGRDGFYIGDPYHDEKFYFGTRSECIKAHCYWNGNLNPNDFDWYIWKPKQNNYVIFRKKREKKCKTQE